MTPERSVSILVFLEPPLIHPPLLIYRVRLQVSILVFLEPPLILKLAALKQVAFEYVSILVFLEPPLILLLSSHILSEVSGFNPCFSGTTTYT